MTDLSGWPALVLTAGLATRLRPLSNVRAKAAMPVAGTPIVSRLLRWLRAAGVRDVVLNLHHKPETVTRIIGDGSQFGLRVRYSWETNVLGSAGGPRHALPLLESDTFFIVNGDTLTDCDLAALAARHQHTNARVTMAVVDGDVQRYGGVLIDDEDRVVGFGKPGPRTRAHHFIGVQAVAASVFADLQDNEPHETVRALYPRLIAANRGAVQIFHSEAEFFDVGTVSDYLATVAAIAGRENKPYDMGMGCHVAADAHIERSVLWDHVRVGAGARIVDSVLADNVVIPAGAHVERQAVVA
jgi:NDP-sugar pyrophosphorylase family protein